MQAAVQAAIKYIQTSKSVGSSDDALQSITAHRVDNLLTMIGKVNISLDESSELMMMISKSAVFNADQSQRLIAAIQSAVKNIETGSLRIKSQSIKIEKYLTAELHSKLQTLEANDRVAAIVEYLQDVLGCKYPDVPSRKRVVAVMFLIKGEAVAAKSLKSLYDLVGNVNIKRRKMRHSSVTCTVFPDDPAVFCTSFPGRFKELPISAPFSEAEIHKVELMVPARKNNLALQGIMEQPPEMQCQPAAMQQPPQMQQMMQMMQMAMNCMQMANGNGTGLLLPGLTTPSAPTTAPPAPLAIGDAPRSPSPMLALTNVQSTQSLGECNRDDVGAPSEGSDTAAEDDIDKMIQDAAKPATKHVKSKSMPKSPKQDSCVEPPPDRPSKKPKTSSTVSHTKAPAFGVKLPCEFNGCKIYGCYDKFRVVPFPGESRYDRKFNFTDDKSKKAVWESVIQYCKHPYVPTESVNCPKKTKPGKK